jgi:hypothetical protein
MAKCEFCRHYFLGSWGAPTESWDCCILATTQESAKGTPKQSHMTGKWYYPTVYVYGRNKNRNCDCPDYEEKSLVKSLKSWWKRLWGCA